MSKEIKQKADGLVEMFRPLISGVTTKNGVLEHFEKERTIKSVAAAILHQKRLIEVLDKHKRLDNSISIKLEILGQKAILTELKSRL